MTEAQKQAVLARDYNAMIDLGGNIYFLAKIFATDGQSFQQAAASMTGHVRRGLRGDDAGRRTLARGLALDQARGPDVARITAGVTTSHVPAIGAALDLGDDRERLLDAALRRLRVDQEMDRRRAARRRHPRLQRPRVGVLPGVHPDLRHRLCRRFRRRRRGLRPATGAERGGSPRTRVSHRRSRSSWTSST